MKVELLVACDFAADYAGKLTLVGVFDSLGATRMPVVHPQLCIAAKMRFDDIEAGPKTARVTLRDADGRDVFQPIEMKIDVPVPNHENAQSVVNLVVHIGTLKFESLGEHALDLSLDGAHLASTPLVLRQFGGG